MQFLCTEDLEASNMAEKVNYELIKQIKNAVSIPVIGNGDITDNESMDNMLETGVDAVSLARASMGQPWIFFKA